MENRAKRRILYFIPLQYRFRKHMIMYVLIPLILLIGCTAFKLWVDSLQELPAWLAAAVGRRNVMESDFDNISYETPKVIPPAESFESMVPDNLNTAMRDGYIDAMATNERYDGYTCAPNAPTDIIVMDIQPHELEDTKQTIMLVKLYNTGAAAKDVLITFQAQGGSVYEGRIDIVPSCSSQARFRWTPGREGEIEVTAVVNADKAVEETDYNNNAKTVTVFVGKRVTSDVPLVPAPESSDYVEWTEDEHGQVIDTSRD